MLNTSDILIGSKVNNLVYREKIREIYNKYKNSVLPMILKAGVVGMVIGLFIGVYEFIANKRNWDLGGSYSSSEVHYNQHYRNESIDIDEYQQEHSSWKKEQYMDAS